MKKYRRIDWNDRLLIEKLYNHGQSCSGIAHILGFAPSSIYREVKHGLYPHLGAETTRRPFHYSAQIAQDYADFHATSKVTQKDCDKAAALINAMPRKILNYQTAADLFNRQIANLTENQN